MDGGELAARDAVREFVTWSRHHLDHEVTDALYEFLKSKLDKAYTVGRAHGLAEFSSLLHTVN